jgi:hypothetical protein
LPPDCPYLATSNVSPNNKFNTNNMSICSEIELVITSGWQIWSIDKVFHTMMASWQYGPHRLGGRNGLSPWGIA